MNKITFFGEFSNFNKFVLGAISQSRLFETGLMVRFFWRGGGESGNAFVISDHMDFSLPKKCKIICHGKHKIKTAGLF